MTADQARAIIAQAQKDGTAENDVPIPEDDGQAIAKAEDLVAMAQEAWNANIRGPEVEVLLRLAASETPGEVTEEPQETPTEEQPPEPPPEEPTNEQPADEPEPEPEESPTPEEGTPTPEEPVQDSEPEPEGEPAPEAEEDEDLSKIEPWEEYHTERVGDIKAGIDAAVEQYDKDELRSLLAHIWAFEAAHRDRKAIIGHLEKVASEQFPDEEMSREEAEGPQEEPPAAEEGADTSAEPEAAERAEAPDQGGEGDGEAVPAPDREPGADASPVADEQAPEQGEEGGADAAEPTSQAGRGTDTGTGGGAGSRDADRRALDAALRPKVTGPFQEVVADVEEELGEERLQLPTPPEADPEQLPEDWTTLSDNALQRLYGQYSNYTYYLNGVVTRHESIAARCKQAADEMANELFVAANKFDERGKQRTMTDIESECEADEAVKLWRRRQRNQETLASAKRRERDAYDALVTSLSRLETMRHNEWERSGNKIGRSRTK